MLGTLCASKGNTMQIPKLVRSEYIYKVHFRCTLTFTFNAGVSLLAQSNLALPG